MNILEAGEIEYFLSSLSTCVVSIQKMFFLGIIEIMNENILPYMIC